MLYVGIDWHARTFSFAAEDEDCKVVFEATLPSSCGNLHEAMESIAAKKRVVLEQSDLASWAYRVFRNQGTGTHFRAPDMGPRNARSSSTPDEERARNNAARSPAQQGTSGTSGDSDPFRDEASSRCIEAGGAKWVTVPQRRPT